MKPVDALKDDVTNFIARMREEQYPELEDDAVRKILQDLARGFFLCEYDRFRLQEECELNRPATPAPAPTMLARFILSEGNEHDPNFDEGEP